MVMMIVLEAIGVPENFSARSNRIYSDRAKMALLVLRQYLDLSYEEFSENLGSMQGVIKAAGIKYVPEQSTLRKFSGRIDHKLLDLTIWHTAAAVCGTGIIAAMDSTGFSSSNASMYFVKRIKEMPHTKKGIEYSISSVRGYVKTSIAVDTSTLVVLAADVCPSNVSDVRRLPSLVDDMKEAGYDVKCVVADKGYDSEAAHRYVRENLGCETMIPVRRNEPAVTGSSRTRTSGFYRGLMKFFFDPIVYGKRPKVETVNSMIKRKMSGTVYGKNDGTRSIEVLCRCVAHNVRRIMDLGAAEALAMVS